MRLFARFSRAVSALLLGAFATGTHAGDDDKEKKSGSINIPLPVGEKAKGLSVPLYDEEGNLTMTLKIPEATKLDEKRMQMIGAAVQTFSEQDGKKEQPDLLIELQKSVIDLDSRVVTSEDPVKIERRDFSLTGDSMEFDLKSKNGEVRGNVRMLIYDRNEISNEKPKPE